MNSFEKQTTRSGSRRMAFLCALVFSLGAVFGMLAGGVHRLSASSSMTDAPAFAIFEETWNLVQERYVLPEELDETDLIYGAARGMVEAVGDTGHSAFLDPVEAQSFRASLNGELIGVGIRIEFNGEYPQVIAPIDGSPAESAGIESGDFILKIDGRDTSRMTPNEVGTLLRGEEGAPVDLTIGRPETETEFDITIVRARIEVEPVAWAELPDGLFLLRLNEFSEGAGEALTQAIEEVIAGGATGIVLDLRGNPGGYVDEAKRVASEFLPAGSVLYFEQRRGEEPEPITLDREAGAARTMPLVVLVNERSASAAEIVAASLRDNARAEVIGVNTFGTATVVSSFGLDDGSIASIGTALWTTPNRESVRNVGVSPTIEVKLSPLADETEFESGSFLTLAEIHANDDAQLLAAIELLSPPDVLPTALTA